MLHKCIVIMEMTKCKNESKSELVHDVCYESKKNEISIIRHANSNKAFV